MTCSEIVGDALVTSASAAGVVVDARTGQVGVVAVDGGEVVEDDARVDALGGLQDQEAERLVEDERLAIAGGDLRLHEVPAALGAGRRHRCCS